jgi:Zn-dependent peptidase ImmA (M78 family)
VITVNSGTQKARQRFSLAHEIGHWINDRGKNLSIECSTGDINQKENGKGLTTRQAREARANIFASHLMMPDFMMTDIANIPVNMDTVRCIASTYNTSLISSAGRLIELTKKPAMVVLWSHNGTRRWFDRSASLSESIWPLQSITHPAEYFIASNNIHVNDSKWIDPQSAKGNIITESVFDNGYDVISLFSWI